MADALKHPNPNYPDRELGPNERAAVWNAEVSIGTPVEYRKDDGSIVHTFTRSVASVLGDHTAVVWLEAVRGCVALDRVSPTERT